MVKIIPWDDAKAAKIIKQRYDDAVQKRRDYEDQWRQNEITLYNELGMDEVDMLGPITADTLAQYAQRTSEEANDETGVNYIFKHHRFLAAQMSANPPTVQARPTSSDPADRRRADTADRLCRHAIRAYAMQERFDLSAHAALLYGTSIVKTVFDENKGEIESFDSATGELQMSGDYSIENCTIWDIWVDPFARQVDDIKYVFERIWITLDEAEMLYPDKINQIKMYLDDEDYERVKNELNNSYDTSEKRVPVIHYYEKGLPVNGMQGRYFVMLPDGVMLKSVTANPVRFYEPPQDRNELEELLRKEEAGLEVDYGPEVAMLPYHFLTDIDVVDHVYGKSFIEYAIPGQDTINYMDTLQLDNVKAHGVTRLVVDEDADIAADSIKDTPWEVVKISGGRAPHFISAPSLMPEVNTLRDRHKQGVDDMAGVNESMYGQQSREQSGFSMQYATNQGNMIRRRIFNKYVLMTESVYRMYLALVQRHWRNAKTIKILGKEKSFQLYDIKGSDILGGYDLVVEYGSSLSLDPTARREEIMALMPLFEKAGVEPRVLMEMLKLNELGGQHDELSQATARQQEIFERIIEYRGEYYIQPREMADHKNMLIYCNRYLMTAEFRDLDPKIQILIEKHIKERVQLLAGKPIEGAPTGQGGQMPAAEPLPVEEGGLATPDMGQGAALPAAPPAEQL